MPSITLSPSSTHSSPAYKNVLHYLYFKKHESPKEDAKTPKDRTLFLLNIPVDATESQIRELFKPYGRVQQQQAAPEEEMNHHRTLFASGSQAYVVFLEEQELTKVLNMKRKKRSWIHSGSEATPADSAKLSSLGVAKWIGEYSRMRPEHSDLQARVDEYMDKFERSEYEAQQAAQARLNVMDEDGFTVVTSAGNKGYNTDGVIRIQAIKAEEAKKIKPKKKELQDFYRFQMREAKRDKLVELRRKFEEDKVRIEALKVNRRFKPY
ncbi:MAG: SSU rRNA processing protein [Benniella sp.]|nr:MAG: SSU rRNA processing protein [Benniella sp.]